MKPSLQYVYDKHKRRQIKREQLRQIKVLKLIEHLKNIKPVQPMKKSKAKDPFILTAMTLAIIAVSLFAYLGKTPFSYGICGVLCLGSFVSTLIYLTNKNG